MVEGHETSQIFVLFEFGRFQLILTELLGILVNCDLFLTDLKEAFGLYELLKRLILGRRPLDRQ